MPIKVYIAGPYSQGDVGLNVHKALALGSTLLDAGFVPYVPHLTHFWHLQHPEPKAVWQEYDKHWLGLCDAVLRLPGPSEGADEEVAWAKAHNIPVFYTVTEIWTLTSEKESDAAAKDSRSY